MPTNLSYIEDTLEKAMDRELSSPTITKSIRDEAGRKARKLIGGFRVLDKKVEEAEIDRVIKVKHDIVAQFRKNRKQIIKELADLGVKPLAVVPSGAWYILSKQAGLYTMHPDNGGKVGVDRSWYTSFSEKGFPKASHASLLKAFFPDSVSVDPAHQRVTPILPNPPEDVVETLLKVQKRKLSVTAVPDAISFAESRDQIWSQRGTPKDIWAREQGYEDYADWLKRDPIIFTEEGNAAAIIAQFGDFPIEKELVDKVVDADSIMALKPGAVNDMIVAQSGLISQHMEAKRMRYEAEMQRAMQSQQGPSLFGGSLVGGRGQALASGLSNNAANQLIYDSRTWTGY